MGYPKTERLHENKQNFVSTKTIDIQMRISKASSLGLENVTSHFFSFNIFGDSVIESNTYQKHQTML